jgi:phosphomannomutase
VSGTRIASVSGLRGVVGDGLDPAIVVEFAAAYASGCGRGPIVVGHDGRVSAPVFVPAVLAAVTATGRDVLLAGARPRRRSAAWSATWGPRAASRSRRRTTLPPTTGSSSSSPRAWSSARPRGARSSIACRLAISAGRPGMPSGRSARRGSRFVASRSNPRAGRSGGDPPPQVHRGPRRLSRLRGSPRGRLLRALGCETIVLGGLPDGRYDHPPEPTEANLRAFCALVPAVGAAVGFAQDPDADRLRLIDETGRYIGEELTLALAALRRSRRNGGRWCSTSRRRA